MTRMVQEYNRQGFYTIAQAAKMAGMGQTTIRRHEGKLFPRAAKTGRNRVRLFTKEQVDEICRRWRERAD